MNDEKLITLIRSVSNSGAQTGRQCPDEALLVAWVDGNLPEAQRENLEEHIADCAFCCGQVGFLVRVAELGPPPAVPAQLLARARGERPSWIAWLRPATIAVASAGLVAALFLLTPLDRSKLPYGADATPSAIATSPRTAIDPQVRTRNDAKGSPWIIRPLEGESIARTALELQWEEAPYTLFYTVQIVDPKGDVVWEGRAEKARLKVPPDVTLTTGQPYFAWVLAHLRSGATVRSPAVGFRLAPG